MLTVVKCVQAIFPQNRELSLPQTRVDISILSVCLTFRKLLSFYGLPNSHPFARSYASMIYLSYKLLPFSKILSLYDLINSHSFASSCPLLIISHVYCYPSARYYPLFNFKMFTRLTVCMLRSFNYLKNRRQFYQSYIVTWIYQLLHNAFVYI